MILVEEHPKNPEISEFVDRYQLFVIEEEAYLKTVPNGKIELFYILKGGFDRWNDQKLKFDFHSKSGFLPSSNQLSFFHVPKRLFCLNIKLSMKILGLSYFENFTKDWAERKTSEFIPPSDESLIRKSIDEKDPSIDVGLMDRTFVQIIQEQKKNQELMQLIDLIEKDINDQFKVTSLADQMNMSAKTLERKTKKFFNLTPKDLWKVIRFEHATSHLKRNENQRLIDALSFGYYDQSHFIKECKKVTGYTPTDFFSKLKFSTNDLIIESDNPTI